MNKSTIVICLVLILPFIGNSQDVHFSFPEFTPLSINPALAGANNAMEGMVNYRNQWSSLGEPYKTTAAAFHARVNKSNRRSNFFALGLQLMNDKAGLPGITGNSAMLTVANHVMLSKESKIGAGLTLGYMQRTITDFSGQWATQYDGTAYNAGLASGEIFSTPTYGFLDIGAGMVYTYQRRQSTLAKRSDRFLSAGISINHVNRPNYSFLASGEDRLPIRYTAFANGEIALSTTDFSILPGIWYHRQGPFTQFLFGSSVRVIIVPETRYTGFKKPFSLSVGMYGRINDAAVARLTVDYDRFSLGYAFDFNTSGLNNYTGGRGAQEIFLRFNLSEIGPIRGR
jgi:type IX secretion system PorP/SprF family membrane protein